MDGIQMFLCLFLLWWALGCAGTYSMFRRRYASIEDAFTYEPVGFFLVWLMYPIFLGPVTMLMAHSDWRRGPK